MNPVNGGPHSAGSKDSGPVIGKPAKKSKSETPKTSRLVQENAPAPVDPKRGPDDATIDRLEALSADDMLEALVTVQDAKSPTLYQRADIYDISPGQHLDRMLLPALLKTLLVQQFSDEAAVPGALPPAQPDNAHIMPVLCEQMHENFTNEIETILLEKEVKRALVEIEADVKAGSLTAIKAILDGERLRPFILMEKALREQLSEVEHPKIDKIFQEDLSGIAQKNEAALLQIKTLLDGAGDNVEPAISAIMNIVKPILKNPRHSQITGFIDDSYELLRPEFPLLENGLCNKLEGCKVSTKALLQMTLTGTAKTRFEALLGRTESEKQLDKVLAFDSANAFCLAAGEQKNVRARHQWINDHLGIYGPLLFEKRASQQLLALNAVENEIRNAASKRSRKMAAYVMTNVIKMPFYELYFRTALHQMIEAFDDGKPVIQMMMPAGQAHFVTMLFNRVTLPGEQETLVISYQDSLVTQLKHPALAAIEAAANTVFSELGMTVFMIVNPLNAAHQKDAHNCGLFAIMNSIALLKGNDAFKEAVVKIFEKSTEGVDLEKVTNDELDRVQARFASLAHQVCASLFSPLAAPIADMGVPDVNIRIRFYLSNILNRMKSALVAAAPVVKDEGTMWVWYDHAVDLSNEFVLHKFLPVNQLTDIRLLLDRMVGEPTPKLTQTPHADPIYTTTSLEDHSNILHNKIVRKLGMELGNLPYGMSGKTLLTALRQCKRYYEVGREVLFQLYPTTYVAGLTPIDEYDAIISAEKILALNINDAERKALATEQLSKFSMKGLAEHFARVSWQLSRTGSSAKNARSLVGSSECSAKGLLGFRQFRPECWTAPLAFDVDEAIAKAIEAQRASVYRTDPERGLEEQMKAFLDISAASQFECKATVGEQAEPLLFTPGRFVARVGAGSPDDGRSAPLPGATRLAERSELFGVDKNMDDEPFMENLEAFATVTPDSGVDGQNERASIDNGKSNSMKH